MSTRMNNAFRRLAVTVLFTWATSALMLTGCDNEGEGERCTLFGGGGGDASANGTDECSAGLICQPAPSYYSTGVTLSGVGTLGICCPPSGQPVTASVCAPGAGGSTTGGQPTDASFDAGTDGDAAGSDAAVPTDGAADSASKVDGAKDATGDTATDSTADATKDATTGG